jgi:hypothetical protein
VQSHPCQWRIKRHEIDILRTLVSKTAEEAQAIGSSQSENISLVLRSVDALQGSIGGCRNELSSIKDTLFAKERSDILEWISNSVDPSQNYNQAIKQRNIVTGRWLTESNDFTHWIDTPGFLWLHGIRTYTLQSLYTTNAFPSW